MAQRRELFITDSVTPIEFPVNPTAVQTKFGVEVDIDGVTTGFDFAWYGRDLFYKMTVKNQSTGKRFGDYYPLPGEKLTIRNFDPSSKDSPDLQFEFVNISDKTGKPLTPHSLFTSFVLVVEKGKVLSR